MFFKNSSVSTNVLIAFYKVAYIIAKCKLTQTVAEKVILPIATYI